MKFNLESEFPTAGWRLLPTVGSAEREGWFLQVCRWDPPFVSSDVVSVATRSAIRSREELLE